ncbi:MAG: Methyl-accepting chemotaxis protein PctC [Acidobacteria bacterium ADurb.Bin340]|nr:MAG: Methyl-accepting chemotaxis protein PctC [Acidobacteria bacterium ADurb.Bin340]
MIQRPNVHSFRQSFSFRLGGAFALLLLAAVVVMGAYAFLGARRSAIQTEFSHLQFLAGELASGIDVHLAKGWGLAEHLAHTRDVRDYLDQAPRSLRHQEEILAWLDHHQGRTPGLAAIFILSPEGRCLASSQRSFMGSDFSFRTYFQEARAGRAVVSDWTLGVVTRTPRVFMAAPVQVAGRFAGAIVTEFEMEGVEAILEGLGARGRTAALINAQGVLVAHTDAALRYRTVVPLEGPVLDDLERNRQFLGREIPVAPVSPEFAAAFRKTLGRAALPAFSYRLEGTEKWATMAPLTQRPWVLAVTIPQATILAPVRRAFIKTLAVGLALILVLTYLAWRMGRAFVAPLQELAAAMDRFGVGEMTARAPVSKEDERGRLAIHFNAMAEAIHTHQEEMDALVRARTRELETTVAEIKSLHGLIPICSYCKRIRDEQGAWLRLERYIQEHSEATFSHGVCPECREQAVSDLEGRSADS